MIKVIVRIGKNLLMVLMTVVAFSFTSSCAGNRIMTDHPKSLYALIDALIVASPPLDRAMVERLTGAKLMLVSSNAATNFYETHDIKLEDTSIELIDYRDSPVGYMATSGPLLNFELTNSCFSRKDIITRYGTTEITPPSPHGIGSETEFKRLEPWGYVSFGFSQRSPDCLKSVVIFIKTPPMN